MTRQLLEAAAKAMGLTLRWEKFLGDEWCVIDRSGRVWNPKSDRGDCFDMETALRLDGPHWGEDHVWYGVGENCVTAVFERFADHPNPDAARRMAALRAAASLPPKETK